VIRRRWWVAAVLALVLLLPVVLAWLALPAVARWLLVRQVEAVTGRRVTIERFDLGIAGGHLEIGGFRLADREPGPPLAEVERLDVRFEPRALLRGHLHVTEAAVTAPRVRIVRSAKGELNVDDLLGRAGRERPAAVSVDRLTVGRGMVTVEDHSRVPARTWRVEAIAAEASGLSTVRPEMSGTAHLTATVAGGSASLDLSELRLFPLHARARLVLQDVDATLASMFLYPQAPLVLDRAHVSTTLTARLDAGEGLRVDGQGRLDNLAIRRPDAEAPLAIVPILAFVVQSGEVPSRAVSLSRLEVSGSATVFDLRSSPPPRFEIDRLRLLVEDTSGPDAPARVSLTARLPGGGDLDVQGTARFAPIGAQLRAQVTRLDLVPWAALVRSPVRLAGMAEADVAIDLTQADRLSARVRGRAAASGVGIAEGGRQLARAERVELTGVDAEWPRLRVGRIRVVRPALTAERDAMGRIAFPAFPAGTGPAAPARSAGSSAPSPPAGFTVDLNEVVVEEGVLALRDAAAAGAAPLQLSAIRLSARGLAWPAGKPAKIALTARTPGVGTLTADGTLSLDAARLDVRGRLAGVALAPYQPYMPVRTTVQGRLDADVAVAGSLGSRPSAGVRGTVTVSDLALSDGPRSLTTVARLETTGLDYAWPASVTIERLRVLRPSVPLERRPDGTVSLAALSGAVRESLPPASLTEFEGKPAPDPARAAASPPLHIAIRETVVEGAGATFIDGAVSPPARLAFAGVGLVVHNIAWPARGATALQLQAPTPGGGRLTARGQLNLGGPRRDASLHVVLSDVALAAVQPYVPVRARVGGQISGDLEVKVNLDPLAISAQGTASLADLAVADGDRPLLTVGHLETAGLDYTWPARVAIDRLRVQKSWAKIERTADGAFTLRTLLGRAPVVTARTQRPAPGAGEAAPSASSPIEVTIREGAIEGGAMIVDAAVRPAARFDVAGVRLAVRELTWPARGPAAVQLRVPMPEGGELTARGQLDLAAPAAGMDLRVAVAGVALAPAQPYLPFRARVAAKAGADLGVKVTLDPLAITAEGTAVLTELSVADRDRPLMTASRLEASGVDYRWPATVAIDRLRAIKAWALLERTADGGLSLRALLGPPASTSGSAPRRTAASTPAVPAVPALDLRIRRSVMEDAAVTLADSAVNPGAHVDITGARLALNDLAWPVRGPTGVRFRAPMPAGGTMEASGQLRLDMSSLDLRMALNGVDLAPAGPYLGRPWTVAGKADADLAIKGTLAPPALSVLGKLAVADAVLGDGQRQLVSVKRLDASGVNADWPRRVVVERVTIRQPWSLVERDADGRFHLLSLVARGTPGTDPASASGRRQEPAPSTATGMRVEVGAFVVEDGFVRFVDRTTSPSFVEEASRMAVAARRLGTESATRSQISVGGRLTGGTPFELTGVAGPLAGPLILDVQGQLSDFALSRLNPYANRLLGWVARRGALTARVHYQVNGDRLDATNDIVMARPEFVPSRHGDDVRERVGLPLDVLVALLEDTRKEVHLSIPVKGNLASRQFDFGDSVWDALRKAAINVLALPVSWVGKIFYTADARIDTVRIWPVSFEAGTTRMRRGLDAHAARLASFLREAPALNLIMKSVLTVEDVDALKRDVVRQRIDAQARAAGQPDAGAIAARLFAERFPGRPPPDLATIMHELAKEEPVPEAALSALAAERVELVRRELEARGSIDPSRLRPADGVVPIEASGAGRVEFEIGV
jgi:uncharacterized protein involved in outer membrane biogenesis